MLETKRNIPTKRIFNAYKCYQEPSSKERKADRSSQMPKSEADKTRLKQLRIETRTEKKVSIIKLNLIKFWARKTDKDSVQL